MLLPRDIGFLALRVRRGNRLSKKPEIYAIPNSAISKEKNPDELYLVIGIAGESVYGLPIAPDSQKYLKVAKWIGNKERTIFSSQNPSGVIQKEDLSDLL